MNKYTLSFFLLLLLSFSAKAQPLKFYITGHVKTQAGENITGANALLLHPKDSSLITGTVTDEDGRFGMRTSEKSVLIKIAFVGFENYFIMKDLDQPLTDLKTILLKPKTLNLKEANVQGTVIPVQQKGDTTEMNADAFKVNKDATAEDLATKMPGITIEQGKVKAQGEDVKQVTVDGRPFFGDDPNSVLKNLPAEVIDKIQVFDKKSDQSQFTGFDDGNSSKTLNIVTRPQFRNGTFGKVYGGYGTDDRYKAGFNLNFFKDKRRITLLGNINNVNEQNFSADDLLGVMSSGGSGRQGMQGGFGGRTGGGPRGGGGGRPQDGGQNSADNFLVDQKNGITNTNSFGINYSDKWKAIEFSGSYFFNYTDNDSRSDLYRTYVTNLQEGLIYDETNEATSKNYNHRMNLKFDWKIDSSNSLLFQPRISYQKNNGGTLLYGVNYFTDSMVSNTANNNASDLQAWNIASQLFYRHSFSKKGRTVSLSATPGYNSSSGNGSLNTYTNYFADTLTADTLNQIYNLDKQGEVFSSNLMYTEPVNTSSQVYVSVNSNYNNNNSDKKTYNFSIPENAYAEFDTTLSNTFNSIYFSNALGTGYRYQKDKWNASVGISAQMAQLKNEQQFPESYHLDKKFNSILPNAFIQYKFTLKKNLRIFYRSNNTAPTVTQLQNVVNNSNPLQLSIGNPYLKQDFQNSVNIRYSSVNTDKGTAFFALLSGATTMDYIGNNSSIATKDSTLSNGMLLAAGSQITSQQNYNGYYNLRTFLNYSLPLKKIKCNLSLNGGGGYSHLPSMINGLMNYAGNSNYNLGAALSSNISEKIDFSVSSNTSFNDNKNTLQSGSNNQYLNQYSRVKVQVTIWKGLIVQTDLNHQIYKGLTDNYNDNYYLWNAALGYKFLKNNAAEFRLSVFDILNQNNSITRNATDTYYEDVHTNVLQRYGMLTFTYNIKSYKENQPKH